MFRVSRRRARESDQAWLPWKIGCLLTGLATGIVGMTRSIEWLTWVAVAVLAMGFLLRFVPRGKDFEEGPEAE